MIFRILFGFILAIFLPGYLFSIILFPRKDDIDGIERMALSFILSLAITPLLGLTLNYTPFGIRLVPILIIMFMYIILLSIITCVMRMTLADKERFMLPLEALFKFNLKNKVTNKLLLIILMISILGSFITIIYVMITPKIGERYTEFYLIGQNGIGINYLTDLKVNEEEKMLIVIINHEYQNMTYHLNVNFNEFSIYKEEIFLLENEKREIMFILNANEKGKNQKLEFFLYKNHVTEVYRTLYILINVT